MLTAEKPPYVQMALGPWKGSTYGAAWEKCTFTTHGTYVKLSMLPLVSHRKNSLGYARS